MSLYILWKDLFKFKEGETFESNSKFVAHAKDYVFRDCRYSQIIGVQYYQPKRIRNSYDPYPDKLIRISWLKIKFFMENILQKMTSEELNILRIMILWDLRSYRKF